MAGESHKEELPIDVILSQRKRRVARRPHHSLEVRVRVGLLLGLAVLLAVVWVVSFVVFHVAGFLIHLLLILALVFLILQLFAGKKI